MSSRRGFTLIELLVVIAIISLISSVVLTSLENGRRKATDAAIKQQLTQMRTLMHREFDDTGSYANLKSSSSGGQILEAETCPTVGAGASNLRGTYAQQFKNACDSAKSLVGSDCGTAGLCLQFSYPAGATNTTRFSLLAYLPGESRAEGEDMYLCMGSSGTIAVTDDVGLSSAPGCPDNP